MKILVMLLIAALTMAISLPGQHKDFMVMTVLSVLVLLVLPTSLRKHTSKVGIYTHEVSHGVVSYMTGGEFHKFIVDKDWGVCLTSGGNKKLIVSAGYIGTVLLGSIFLAKSAKYGIRR